jgi:hypothetical protein
LIVLTSRPRGREMADRLAAVATRPAVLAGVGYLLAFLAVTWPLASRLSSSTYGGPGDGWALIWQTRFRFEHGFSYFSPTFSTDIGWPVGGELTSSLLLSNAVVELPYALLLALGFGDVTAYNLIVLLAGVTSSLAMYGVTRRLGCRPAVAFWAGLAYLLAPWHLEKLSIHPTLASMAALPLLLLGIVEWTRRPGLRTGALLVGAAALATYTHSYFGIGTGLVLLAALPVVLLAARRRRTLSDLLPRTALVASALVVVPIPLAFALDRQSSAVSLLLDRPLYLFALAARPYQLLLPSIDNPVFGGLSRRYVDSRGVPANEGELALYLGLVTITLAAVAIISAAGRPGRRLPTAIAAVMTAVGLAMSAPALVETPLGSIRAPVAYVTDVFSFISTPARFFAFTLTGAVVLAALGLQTVVERIGGGRALAIVAAVCVLSTIELPFRRDDLVVDTGATPLVRAIERVVPEREPVAEYPSMESFYRPVAKQLFYQLEHGRPLLNGAPATSLEDSVRLGVENPSNPATPSLLALLGYRWAAYDIWQAAEKAELIGTSTEDAFGYRPPRGFEVVARPPEGSLVMRVTAEPAAGFATIATGFTRAGRWVTRDRATILACATAAGEYTLRFKAGAFAVDRLLTIGDSPLIILDASGGEQRVRTRVHLRPGWQLLIVELIGAPPIRPSDVIPGEADSRPLAVSIGPISVTGPKGSPAPCQRPGPLSSLRTVE